MLFERRHLRVGRFGASFGGINQIGQCRLIAATPVLGCACREGAENPEHFRLFPGVGKADQTSVIFDACNQVAWRMAAQGLGRVKTQTEFALMPS